MLWLRYGILASYWYFSRITPVAFLDIRFRWRTTSARENDAGKLLFLPSFRVPPTQLVYLQKTLADLQKALEDVESPQTFLAILGTVVSIAAAYPEIFWPHFKVRSHPNCDFLLVIVCPLQDIVDIVVGWYVDTEQDEATLAKCGDSLSKLQTFWLRDMEFTLSMMMHFLEDAETYIEVKTEFSDNEIYICNRFL